MIARIVGIGSYLPEKKLTNADLEKMIDTTNDWIISRTGIEERRIAADDEYTSTLGIRASEIALNKAGVEAKDIDMIMVATVSPDYLFPCTAALIQKEIGAINAAAFDLQAACTGFLYGLSVAKAFIESGMYKNVLVVASEKLSSITNYKDRNTCVLFGDGASAALVSDEGEGLWVRDVTLGADGSQYDLLMLQAGGSKMPASEETVSKGLHYIEMKGKEVFKYAVRSMSMSSKKTLKNAGLDEKDINWLIPHQANDRIIDAIAQRFDIKNVFKTLHKYGNTSASSVIIALDELLQEHNIDEGDNLLLTAFGAGLTYGSAILTKVS